MTLMLALEAAAEELFATPSAPLTPLNMEDEVPLVTAHVKK